MSSAPATTPASPALLDRAVGYTVRALEAARDADLDAATPCSGWTLRDLLRHMDDSLAAFTEAAETGRIALAPRAVDATAADLAQRLHSRACAMLEVWHDRIGDLRVDQDIGVGTAALQHGVIAGIGALEITVHGWDIARAVGVEHPIPEPLARALLEVALDVVGEPDRHTRFAPAVPTDTDDAGERLLAHLGR